MYIVLVFFSSIFKYCKKRKTSNQTKYTDPNIYFRTNVLNLDLHEKKKDIILYYYFIIS